MLSILIVYCNRSCLAQHKLTYPADYQTNTVTNNRKAIYKFILKKLIKTLKTVLFSI
ncbi:hypothetical protein SAMN05444360_11981 [Chryseobacterium carnipullorum]|uniref:Uncharacterized protein n=1 Tax=Chryseobacterium carnipullorum TaxID=1124835 RepID=A0A1M7M598_CHRCU|nr:hypothetical protein SAMN05444360_11981 [Chryseobacterium carnipullorum]STC94283.1 Uncharacterised protein [Chryseobacterium carnipullorum]